MVAFNIAYVGNLIRSKNCNLQVAYTQILPCEGIEEAVGSAKCEDRSLQSASFFHKKVNSWHQHRITASRKAQHAYSHLLHLCPQQASGYADLAIAVELVAPFDQSKREDLSAWLALCLFSPINSVNGWL